MYGFFKRWWTYCIEQLRNALKVINILVIGNIRATKTKLNEISQKIGTKFAPLIIEEKKKTTRPPSLKESIHPTIFPIIEISGFEGLLALDYIRFKLKLRSAINSDHIIIYDRKFKESFIEKISKKEMIKKFVEQKYGKPQNIHEILAYYTISQCIYDFKNILSFIKRKPSLNDISNSIAKLLS